MKEQKAVENNTGLDSVPIRLSPIWLREPHTTTGPYFYLQKEPGPHEEIWAPQNRSLSFHLGLAYVKQRRYAVRTQPNLICYPACSPSKA